MAYLARPTGLVRPDHLQMIRSGHRRQRPPSVSMCVDRATRPSTKGPSMARLTALRSFVIRAFRATGEAGASLVEYTLLVALIAAVAIGAITVLGNGAKSTLCNAGTTIAA